MTDVAKDGWEWINVSTTDETGRQDEQEEWVDFCRSSKNEVVDRSMVREPLDRS